ncbi:MAG: Formimidoylglutamase [Gemmatimonadetes bacterium]|nr:Formimidoylglutamase [Gemmatimonadota bacterium]
MALVTPWDRSDPRVENIMGRAVAAGEAPHAVLLGFPTDEGVLRNGGRPGAARGPAEIRRWLARIAPDARDAPRFTTLLEHTTDLGDIALTGNLDADQAALGEVVGGQLKLGRFVIILGGGHETSFGHFLGYVNARLQVDALNWDAHADVRPLRDRLAHSGSPFRQALEHSSGALRRYSVAGLQPHDVSAAHLDLVRKRGRAVFRDEVTPTVMRELYAQLGDPSFVSFDIDAVDQAFAPGVSAPSTGGFTPAEWLAFAYGGGRQAGVRSVDLAEFNPVYDRDGQTGRLAALTIWQVLRGFAARP